MSLRARMLALFFGLGVLPLLLLGVVGYRQSMNAVEELLAKETSSIARRAAADLEVRYLRYQSDLLLLAENLETLDLLRAHYGRGGASWEAEFPAADAYLRQVWDQYQASYRWIEIRDTTGMALYTLGDRGGERVFGNGPSDTGLESVYLFSCPIPDLDGTIPLGDIVAQAPMDQVVPREALAQAFGRSGYSVVLDLLGNRILHHPRRSQLRTTASGLAGDEGWGVGELLLARDSGSFVFRSADSARVASFVNLGTPPWTVVSSTAVDEFSGPFIRTRRLQLVVVTAVTAAVFLAFLILTGRATRSLASLTRAADAVASGDYSPPLPPSGPDEVGRLSAAFGVMAARVEETLRRIQESRHLAVVGEFASRVSHEIRNPLTAVKLNLQRIERHAEKGKLPEECLGPLEISLSEVDRLDRVVRGVLSLARTGAPLTEPCSVHTALNRAILAMTPQLEKSGIEIEASLEAHGDTVVGNGEGLEGVFLNLLLNAAEAMPGGGRISVFSEEVPDPGGGPGWIRIRVRDDGPGVPAELSRKIFEPFYSTKGEGTGFGLSMALNTVEDHGGALRLDGPTGEGEGAVFVMDLPLAPGREGEASG